MGAGDGVGPTSGRPTNNAFRTGEHVALRPLEREDARIVAPWFNDREVVRSLIHMRPMSFSQEASFIAAHDSQAGDVLLGIMCRADDRLVGCTGLHQIEVVDRRATLGLVIGDRREWGKGYGSDAAKLMIEYAFQTLNLRRVELRVYEYNVRAIRIYERLGFKHEGRMRESKWSEGRYWDTLFMSILRDEPRGAPDPDLAPR